MLAAKNGADNPLVEAIKPLHQRIKDARLAKGYSQEKLAKVSWFSWRNFKKAIKIIEKVVERTGKRFLESYISYFL